MTIPVAVLLAFAGWTIFVLATTHGFYRWSRILTGRSDFREFAEYRVEGEKGWYERGMRAHANCVENLVLYGAITVVIVATGAQSPWLDRLALVVIGARVPHSAVHVLFEQTNVVVGFRSAFFIVQLVAMTVMVGLLAAGTPY